MKRANNMLLEVSIKKIALSPEQEFIDKQCCDESSQSCDDFQSL